MILLWPNCAVRLSRGSVIDPPVEFADVPASVKGVLGNGDHQIRLANERRAVSVLLKDEKGHVQKWQGEFSNPGVLSRRGWNAASLEAREKLTITGHPAWKGVLAIHVTRIVSASGALKLELRE
jgi:hypothetical protein